MYRLINVNILNNNLMHSMAVARFFKMGETGGEGGRGESRRREPLGGSEDHQRILKTVVLK